MPKVKFDNTTESVEIAKLKKPNKKTKKKKVKKETNEMELIALTTYKHFDRTETKEGEIYKGDKDYCKKLLNETNCFKLK